MKQPTPKLQTNIHKMKNINVYGPGVSTNSSTPSGLTTSDE